MILFFDTSALAKRYIEEPGRHEVMSLFDRADAICVSVICYTELISAFCRLVREKKLNKRQYRYVRDEASQDFEDFDIYAITPEAATQSARLLESNNLRGMDALHIACAIEAQTDAFVSSDQRQVAAAKKTGLNVFDI